MTKELEALERIIENLPAYKGFLDDITLVKIALRTPTADEVCEALNKMLDYGGFIHQPVRFENNSFVYLSNEGFDEHIIYYDEETKQISFETEWIAQENTCTVYTYTADLLNLISRFYMGVDSK